MLPSLLTFHTLKTQLRAPGRIDDLLNNSVVTMTHVRTGRTMMTSNLQNLSTSFHQLHLQHDGQIKEEVHT